MFPHLEDLIKQAKLDRNAGPSTAGTSDVDGGIVDMAGYKGVIFIAILGTAAANNTLQASSGAAANLGDAATLLGSSIGGEKILVLQLEGLHERYVRPTVKRGTSTTIENIISIRYGAPVLPIENAVASVSAVKRIYNTSEGTP